MLLMIDNYDSFTYNLVQYLRALGASVTTLRNDASDLQSLEQLRPKRLVISPGPCTPNEAGISMAAIRHFCGKIPILGVCLGHQSIGQVFGGRIIRARQVMHGKSSLIAHQGQGVFAGLPDRFSVVRYHSLAIERASLPECLSITAQTEDGEIMGVRHREFPIEGLQFHPESIDTEHGMEMLERFLKSN
ncbi:MAG: aminodeoxychorismate/anthranilate synthase component II [Betaproteobacteria bacterium]|nr:aminodeoxychorismate/anthranilate synthase component II [Pseudomonadota bacterium]NBO12829.1 aminodeoxychorismate/anthranilate synthase component II [Betaproteobacteria bacterium]NBO45066.1 aminodeoxychorismate/anthranilate synthase component II [Betaproteobacteria bacterium]NBP11095.1 aminodeoxychorismate/anthranilate synthase component II [Betaproteobacteria bacterium]NBP61549.1 aminodeoxychorismate/anthranilate synthase component II [Betaproteobacteria bacterium]